MTPIPPISVRLLTGRILLDVLDIATRALDDSTSRGAPARRMLTISGQADDAEQLTVWAARTSPHNPPGSRTVAPPHIPTLEVHVRIVRDWAKIESAEPPLPEDITDKALTIYDDHDAILGALERLARRVNDPALVWSDGAHRDCRMGDASEVGSGDLRGWDFTISVPFS